MEIPHELGAGLTSSCFEHTFTTSGETGSFCPIRKQRTAQVDVVRDRQSKIFIRVVMPDNKLEAAHRQIDTGMRLLFSDDDPLPIQTLAQAVLYAAPTENGVFVLGKLPNVLYSED